YRGAAPINWAVINGEEYSGVTTFFLKHQIDTGDVILQEKVKLEARETAGSLHDKLMNVGGELVIKTFDLIESGDYELKSQDQLIDSNVPIIEAPKIFREDCEIQWYKKAEEVDRLIRGLSPYPSAWTTLKNLSSGK